MGSSSAPFLLATADPEGVAYIQTANIDGEIDLKPRCALSPFLGFTCEALPSLTRWPSQAGFIRLNPACIFSNKHSAF